MDKTCCGTRLCSAALGVAFGVVTGLMMMIFAWVAWEWGYGSTIIEQYGTFYYGYEASLVGGLFGFLWGVIEGFIFGVLVGWIYNCCARCCHCAKKCPTCCGTNSMDSSCRK
jgi:hypothetical protein